MLPVAALAAPSLPLALVSVLHRQEAEQQATRPGQLMLD